MLYLDIANENYFCVTFLDICNTKRITNVHFNSLDDLKDSSDFIT